MYVFVFSNKQTGTGTSRLGKPRVLTQHILFWSLLSRSIAENIIATYNTQNKWPRYDLNKGTFISSYQTKYIQVLVPQLKLSVNEEILIKIENIPNKYKSNYYNPGFYFAYFGINGDTCISNTKIGFNIAILLGCRGSVHRRLALFQHSTDHNF